MKKKTPLTPEASVPSKGQKSLTAAPSVPLQKGQKIEGQYFDYVKNGELHRINATLIDANGCLYNETITDSTFDLILFLEAGWQKLGKSEILHVSYSPKFDSRFFVSYLNTSDVKLIRLSRFEEEEKRLAEMFIKLKGGRP